MKRRSWLLALLGAGGASAQNYMGCVPPQWSSSCPRVNNQCPVCGTMAKEYRPKLGSPEAVCTPGTIGRISQEGVLFCHSWVNLEDAPKDRLIRCKKCAAAFFQDAVV
jgi:hypothetical protein